MMSTMKRYIGTAAVFMLIPISTTYAQNTPTNDAPWIGVVTAQTANIRCGANESYYPVATVKAGDLVRVHGKRQDWLKIETVGSVFADTVGYVKYPSKDTVVFTVAGDYGYATGDVEVLAKNIESRELYRSWRPVLHLQNGDKVRIIDSLITKPGTLHREAYIVHTIQMPTNATAWINSTFIEQATPKQIATFKNEVKTSNNKENNSSETTEIQTGVSKSVTTEDLPVEADVANVVIEDSNSTKNPTPTPQAKPVTTKPVLLIPLSLVELEATWEKITKEPVMGAEVSPLMDMYAELLINYSEDVVVKRIATGRIKQLDVWSKLQKQRIRIDTLRVSLEAKTKKVGEFQSAIAMYENYVIVGRLALSNTFDGRLRPLMFRVQDLKSGRTLGYLPANKDWELSGLLGQIIGVTGKVKWDANWRVNVVEAKRFDILSPTTATVPPDIQ